ncbi:HEAT repeat domain-containing protein [Streptomyces sp. NPDC047130]|uniref:HEAT repeat domain-containing protein n=1 Tax=Streptomyces sp. NPDC047130 TaxID=3155261 RepID=UPI0033D04EA9
MDARLLAAVEAFDAETAGDLVEDGADPDRPLPDGSTPLSRAVASGSPGLVSALLGAEPRLRLPPAERERLLALARRWYEAGAEAGLRRLTGATGAAETVRVEDPEFLFVEEIALDGRTVRGGHGAILTMLERRFVLPTPPGELVARAARTDPYHADWGESSWTLGERRGDPAWRALLTHRHHPSPRHRLFLADHLRCEGVTTAHTEARQREADRLLAAWAAEETEPEVLAMVLQALATADDGRPEGLVAHARHPDRRVREAAAGCLLMWRRPHPPAALAALAALARDDDAGVRAAAATAIGAVGVHADETRRLLLALADDPDPSARAEATRALACSGDAHPLVTDALWNLLSEEDQDLRLDGAFGLARLDDPRAPEAYDRVGRLEEKFHEDLRAGFLLRRAWAASSAGDGPGAVPR